MRYFVSPPAEFYRSRQTSACDNIYFENWLPGGDRGPAQGDARPPTYAEYNYLGRGISSRIKTQHFEVALRLTRQYFGSGNAIDLGCADGVFLPSLSRHFGSVVGIERHPPFAQLSADLVAHLRLGNVNVICNAEKSFADLRRELPSTSYQVLFLLEVMEHIGVKEAMYESKLDFLRQAFTLLDERGVVVISVPKMVGLAFLAQRAGFAVLGISREPISTRDMLRASFLGDTSGLEPGWHNDCHLGFNHRKLEQSLEASEFRIDELKNLPFQRVYRIARR